MKMKLQKLWTIMIGVIKFVASYECLGLQERVHNICLGHAFSEACQYVITNEESVQKSQVIISIKSTQSISYKYMI